MSRRTFTWSQVAGPNVLLTTANSATPTFSSPDILQVATVGFRLIVNDGKTNSSPAEVSMQLTPVASGGVTSAGTFVAGAEQEPVSGTINWQGAPGTFAVVQTSTDLFNWRDIATNAVGFLQAIAFSDAAAGVDRYRFYRAREHVVTQELAAGKALDDFVQVPHNGALSVFPLTLTAWIKTDVVRPDFGIIASKYLPGSANGYSIHLFNGRVCGWYFRDIENRLYAPDTGLDGGFVANGAWQHVAMVVDTSGLRIYVNESQSASLAWTGIPGTTSSTQPLRCGRQVQYPFGGQIGEVTLWGRALTENEIRTNGSHPYRK